MFLIYFEASNMIHKKIFLSFVSQQHKALKDVFSNQKKKRINRQFISHVLSCCSFPVWEVSVDHILALTANTLFIKKAEKVETGFL